MNDFKTINHELTINATPAQVYQALLSSEQHSAFTGAPAVIDATQGGEFSNFNGAITGTIEELQENKLIRMKWRASAFPENYYTDVVFKLEKNENGTTIKFSHQGLPAEAEPMINEGWESNYWQKLPAYLES